MSLYSQPHRFGKLIRAKERHSLTNLIPFVTHRPLRFIPSRDGHFANRYG